MPYEIIKSDAISGLEKLKSNSIKAIITSPPYKSSEGFSWKLMRELREESYRVLKNNGIMFLNFGQLAEDPERCFYIPQDFTIERGKNFMLSSVIAWVKSFPELGGQFTPTPGDRFLNHKWEPIYILYKRDIKLNRLAAGIPYKDKSNLKRYGHKKDRQCRGDVWFFPYSTVQTRDGHPYTWPKALCDNMIKLAGIPKRDIVLDPFCGSGMLGKSVLERKATFIGIERDAKYASKARRMLAKTQYAIDSEER